MYRQLLGILCLIMAMTLFAAAADARPLRCNFRVSDIDFGNIDVLGGGSHSSTGGVRVRCRGNPFQHVTICPSIGSGTGNPMGYDPRQLDKWGASTAKLNFNIFWPSAPNIWGSLHWPYPPKPPIWHIQLNGSGRRTAKYPMPAVVFGGQQTALVGIYISRFQNNHILFEFKAGTYPDCTAPTGVRKPNFRVRARVVKSCMVSATDMDFGHVGDLGSAVDATATITVRCNNQLPYKIRIDGGHTGTADPENRKMTNGVHDITYGIYRDAARTQGWGRWNSNDVNAIGTGYDQTYTAYGRVFAQPTPPPDLYTDTLTVIVVY